MNTAKYLLIPTMTTSLLVLAGCTLQPTTESASGGNTNTVNENASVEVAVNTNATNESGEVDTSDWLTYTNEEYGFSFRYPNNWLIKQEWLEQGLTGSKYNIYLQNEIADSILFFLTTQNFVSEEGEGSIMFLTGSIDADSEFSVNDLQERGIPIYEAVSTDTSIRNIYYTLESYGGNKLNLLTVLQNEAKQFPFLTIGSPLLSDWPYAASTSEIDKIVGEFESGNLKNQIIIDEYMAIVETVQY